MEPDAIEKFPHEGDGIEKFPKEGDGIVRRFFFTYDTSLHVGKMAQLCPESLFKGKGTLAHHRWQINQFGVPNVVKSSDDVVEGLIYSISSTDKSNLDKEYQVAQGRFQRQLLDVTYHEPRQKHTLQISSHVLRNKLGLNAVPVQPAAAWKEGTQLEALVYTSDFKTDGVVGQTLVVILDMLKASKQALTL